MAALIVAGDRRNRRGATECVKIAAAAADDDMAVAVSQCTFRSGLGSAERRRGDLVGYWVGGWGAVGD
jgi:hypothetical protein